MNSKKTPFEEAVDNIKVYDLLDAWERAQFWATYVIGALIVIYATAVTANPNFQASVNASSLKWTNNPLFFVLALGTWYVVGHNTATVMLSLSKEWVMLLFIGGIAGITYAFCAGTGELIATIARHIWQYGGSAGGFVLIGAIVALVIGAIIYRKQNK